MKPMKPMKTLLGVWAHPDDEAYLSAGLMHRVIRAGGRVVCLTATLGEQGTDSPAEWPPARLAAHRERELHAALAAVGVTESRLLGLPDGGCEAHPDDDAISAIAAVIEEIRPDAVVTFGPDGITGHPDHVAVSRWTTEAFRRTDRGSGAGATLLYATMTCAFVARHAEMHDRLGVFPAGYPQPVDDATVALSVELDDRELRTKRAALAAHASQTESLALAMGESTFAEWWATESFRLPLPAPAPLALEEACA